MSGYRPRSIVTLILIGFAVALAPFVAAVVTAIVEVDRLALEGRAAVSAAGSAADDARVLVQQVVNMQRSLGQFSALADDRKLFDIYIDQHRGFQDTIDRLGALDLAGLDVGSLKALAEQERGIYLAAGGEAGVLAEGHSWPELIDRLDDLRSDARDTAASVGAMIQAQANETTDKAEAIQRTLLALTAAAVPATLFLVGLFTLLISRPLRALGLAIRQLGARTATPPIAVSGPRDIEALGQELDWLRRRIETLESQKTSFLQHISHELKTPLTTLREGSDLLVESLREDQREEAEIARLMQINSLHLQELIENLLQFARTRELTEDLALEAQVDIRALVRQTFATQKLAADAKSIRIELRLEPVLVRADPNKLRIVIDNLLNNAIKFTPSDGHITLSARVEGDCAILDIEDTGPGVAEADRDRIFEPFRQGGAKSQGSIKGNGLGLAIARDYVAVHDGTIGLVSSDRGAHFRVRVPVAGPRPVTDGMQQ